MMTYEQILAELTDASVERQVRCEFSPDAELDALLDMLDDCEDMVELKAFGVRLATDKLIPQAIKDQVRPAYSKRGKQLLSERNE